MPRLVVVSRYLKSGSRKNLSNYVKYIATREGAAKTRENYVGYLANRPGAVKFGSHGLFSQNDEPINLDRAAKEVANHNGNVWTHVVSLRRDDAQKMGYDNPTAWRELVKRQIPNIAVNSKIDLANLKWYAAFHDKETNPHVHILVYSTNEREGFLTEHGIEKIRSGFMNDIYADELKHLYQQQTDTRDLLKAESTKLMKQLSEEIANGNCADTETVELMRKLHGQLMNTKGKKVYGYLKREVKKTVDEIFLKLSQHKSINQMYKLWCDMEQSKHDFYSSSKVDFPEMVDNEHFKSVKNMIVNTAAEIRFDFPVTETESVPEEIEDDNDSSFYFEEDIPSPEIVESKNELFIEWSEKYKSTVKILSDRDKSDAEKNNALQQLRSEADSGNVLAIHDMGKYSGDESYYEKALHGFFRLEPDSKKLRPYIQYRIGKMYLYGNGTERTPETAFKWLERSAIAGNKYAQHNLANMFCYGTGTEKDLSKAFLWYSEAARQGMPYSDYALAQMYYYGNGAEQNNELAHEHYRKALSAFLAYDKDDKLLYKIGRMYYCGLGTNVDKPKALTYLLDSAEQGNVQAKRIVAQELLSGEFIPQDISHGILMLTEFADKGDTFAAYKLGKMYFKGEYVNADHDRAEKYLITAAAANNRYAMYTLGKLYLIADKYDLAKAVDLLSKSNSDMHIQPYAAYSLAKILLEDNEYHDTKRAVQLLESAADKNMWASYWLGRIYLFGTDDIAPDQKKGKAWLMKSADDGNEYAQHLLDSADNYTDILFTDSVLGLLSSLSRVLSDDYDKEQRKLKSQVDKKLRKAIDRKKQELGIKTEYGHAY